MFSSFNGTLSNTVGSIFINLSDGKSLYRKKFYVIRTLGVPGIIGADFLIKYTGNVGENFRTINLKKPSGENIEETEQKWEQNTNTVIEDNNTTPQDNFELLPNIEKQLTDCDLIETSKSTPLVGSERFGELMKQINIDHSSIVQWQRIKKNSH